MLTQVRIKNFRGFREFVAVVAPVTAFLGPNSAGKTTALHAIRLSCEMLRLAVEQDAPTRVEKRNGAERILVADGMLIGRHEQLLPLVDWRALFLDQTVTVGSKFALGLGFEASDPIQEIEVEVTCANNEQLKLDVRVASTEALQLVRGLSAKSPLVSSRLKDFLARHRPQAVLVPPFYGTVRDEEARSRVVLDRLLGSGDQSHVVRNLVAALTSEQFTQLNAFLKDTVGATLTHRTSGDALQTEFPLKVQFQDTNGDIELSAGGAGLVNLIALFASLARWQGESVQRRIVFLLDEPEAHLHPRLQAQSAERLARVVTRDFGAQLILATHSVDILNRLSVTGARLLRCDRAATPAVTALDTDASLFDDLSSWADLTPYTAINFLASRRVLFCEGVGDVETLPRLAAIYFRNNPAALARFKRWAIVRLDGASNRTISKLLTRLVNNDVVRAAGRGELQVTVVLDRDHAREPGMRTTALPGAAELEVVWSRHSLESVLLDPRALLQWITAVVGSAAPPDLPAKVEAALEHANSDAELNDAATDQLQAKLATGELREGDRVLTGEQKLIHASRRAREMTRADPGVWQRGKDRATRVLGELRGSIEQPARNQFPTDVLRLIARVDPNAIGDVQAAVPAEVRALFDKLVEDGG